MFRFALVSLPALGVYHIHLRVFSPAHVARKAMLIWFQCVLTVPAPFYFRYPELLTVWRIEPAPAWRAVSSAPGAAAIEFTKVDAADQGQMQNTFAKLNKARQSSKDVGGVDAFPVDLASGSRWPASHGVSLMLSLRCAVLRRAVQRFVSCML